MDISSDSEDKVNILNYINIYIPYAICGCYCKYVN